MTIEILIRDHHESVYRYAYRLAGNPSDAEDLCQQTFLLAHQKLCQLREPDKAAGWLFSIARNTFLKMHRRKRPHCAANLDLDVDQIQQPDVKDSSIDGEKLQSAFDKLGDHQRMILMMFYFEKLSYKEIAERLDVQMGTVMSRLSRAKSKLRGQLINLGIQSADD